MAISEEDCGLIAKAAQDNNVILSVGHVMRFAEIALSINCGVDIHHILKRLKKL
jgi:hypothetical protein